MSSRRRSESKHDDGGLAVVRIKPLGAGGGGGELSAGGDGLTSLHAEPEGIRVTGDGGSSQYIASRTGGRLYTYPEHVIKPEHDQVALYQMFMPQRIKAFLEGVNVNIMAYGQTGSGKTHTMFGPPRLMAKAASGTFGTSPCPHYGLCPRGLLDIVGQLEQLRAASSLQYELTASAVEITVTEGNLDMFSKAARPSAGGGMKDFWFSGKGGVSLDKTTKPPQLFGQEEVPIRTSEDILGLFGAIASRNTAATGMNDSSSRSHCFVFLNLYAFDPSTERVRHSRFQFVDLAGSERMKDAHGTSSWMDAMNAGNMGAIEGVMTNFGLMMLSQRVRELAAARGKRRELLVERSFKTQGDPDLLPLISESLTGSALSLLVVCVSCAPDNASQSINALGFGKEFSRLSVRPQKVREVPLAKWMQRADGLVASGHGGSGGGNPKYAILREAKGRAGAQMKKMLQRLAGRGGGSAAAGKNKKTKGSSTGPQLGLPSRGAGGQRRKK